jgi:hypothetical protein
MNNQERLSQQKNRLSSLTDDSAIGLDFLKQLIEAATGKTVKSIVPAQVFGQRADYTGDNRVFYAINMTLFPANYVPPTGGGGTTVVNASTNLSDYILTSPAGYKARITMNDDYSLNVVAI